MLELKNITKIYKTKKGVKTKALDQVSFTLPHKGLVFIIGKSGSGKSTLLNILGGLDKQTEGDFFVSGKNTSSFKNKDFDYYRNTYIGFVFQEFNLLEEYNVYENILLAMKLQHQKFPKQRVAQLLKNVGLEGFGNRNINELSGGQKQRVAIARAIVKKPDIILADEPTGSLDQKTSREIFTLLKRLSTQKLVIVVSHDVEAAQLYADQIIELSDGKVIKNTYEAKEEENHSFHATKSSLPFLAALKLAFLQLGHKKIRLFFTILLTFLAVSFFGIAHTLTKFNIPKSHAEAMVKEKNTEVVFQKGSYNDYAREWYDSGMPESLEQEDINAIEQKLGRQTRIGYQVIEDNEKVYLTFDRTRMEQMDTLKAYYAYMASEGYFIEVGNKKDLPSTLLGRLPIEAHEIVIHSYLADYIMEMGALIYTDKTDVFKEEYYRPSSYEALLQEGVYLKFGTSKVKIVGIVQDNTKQFAKLKEITARTAMQTDFYSQSFFAMKKNPYQYDKFSEMILNHANQIYVMPGFANQIGLQKNINIPEATSIKIAYNGREYFYAKNKTGYLDKKVKITDGLQDRMIDTLQDNEIIIDENVLTSITGNRYKNLRNDYIKKYKTAYNAQQDKIKAGTLEETEPLLEAKTDDMLQTEFVKKYLTENEIIGSFIELRFTEDNNSNKKVYQAYPHLKIVGLALEDDEQKLYLPRNIASNFMLETAIPKRLYIEETDEASLQKIFTEFPLEKAKYMAKTDYTSMILGMQNILTSISYFALFGSIVFGIFALILLVNFITTSIYYAKKQIGILRALGARKRDVFKIFFYESCIIGILSYILSYITITVVVALLNHFINEILFFQINFIYFTPFTALLLLAIVFLSIFFASLFTVRKIAKMKPVDAILNK